MDDLLLLVISQANFSIGLEQIGQFIESNSELYEVTTDGACVIPGFDVSNVEGCPCSFPGPNNTAINYMEEELIRIEEEIKNTSDHLAKTDINQHISFDVVLQYTRYFLEHIDYLLLRQSNPIQKANYFSLIFDKTPTYREIDSGTKNIGLLTGMNELFSFKNMSKSLMVRERGLEPPCFLGHMLLRHACLPFHHSR